MRNHFSRQNSIGSSITSDSDQDRVFLIGRLHTPTHKPSSTGFTPLPDTSLIISEFKAVLPLGWRTEADQLTIEISQYTDGRVAQRDSSRAPFGSGSYSSSLGSAGMSMCLTGSSELKYTKQQYKQNTQNFLKGCGQADRPAVRLKSTSS